MNCSLLALDFGCRKVWMLVDVETIVFSIVTRACFLTIFCMTSLDDPGTKKVPEVSLWCKTKSLLHRAAQAFRTLGPREPRHDWCNGKIIVTTGHPSFRFPPFTDMPAEEATKQASFVRICALDEIYPLSFQKNRSDVISRHQRNIFSSN